MPEPTNEEIARRYFAASARNDLDTLELLRDADWQERWPATGELITSNQMYRSIHEDFPGGYPHFESLRIAGTGDQFVITPANTVLRLTGGGDLWVGQARVRYGDGSEWYLVKILELRNGLVHRETDYWAPVSEPPEWRRGMTDEIPVAVDQES